MRRLPRRANWGWRKSQSLLHDVSRCDLGWRIGSIPTVCMCAQKLSCNATGCYPAR